MVSVFDKYRKVVHDQVLDSGYSLAIADMVATAHFHALIDFWLLGDDTAYRYLIDKHVSKDYAQFYKDYL